MQIAVFVAILNGSAVHQTPGREYTRNKGSAELGLW